MFVELVFNRIALQVSRFLVDVVPGETVAERVRWLSSRNGEEAGGGQGEELFATISRTTRGRVDVFAVVIQNGIIRWFRTAILVFVLSLR